MACHTSLCGILNAAKIRKTILAKIAQLQADLAALDRLDSQYGKVGDSSASVEAGANVEPLPFDETKSTLATAVRDVISSFGQEPFTKGDVLARLKNALPTLRVNEASVASFLARMGKSEKLKIVQHGAGKTPAKYQNPPSQPGNPMEVV